MALTWAQRREVLLSDCIVSPDVFTPMIDRLAAFVVPDQQALETEAAQRNMHLYLQGLLSHLPSKNAEDITTFVDVQRQVLQECIGTAPWDHRPLIEVLVPQVACRLGHPDGIIAFDPSSFPQRGTHSVGVKRQWCGHRGKVDNCQVGVFMGYVGDDEHALLDFRLSLPQEWARDQPRRQECHVPPQVRYHTRQEQCLEMLDTWGDQVPHGWVTGDDELGRHTQFRRELRERGERYVLGVPCTTTIRDLEAARPEYGGRGRHPKAPWQSVTAWRQSLPADAQGHSVFEFNTDESQCLRRLGCEPAASRRYIGFARPPQEPNSTITERRHHLWDVATAHLRAVFIKCHITYPVQFVLNRPMPSHQLQHATRCRPLGAQTRDPIDHFGLFFARFLRDHLPPHFEYLRQTRPIAVAYQGLTRREVTGLDAPMTHVHRPHALLAIACRRHGKNQLDIGFELRLIVFDEHDIVPTRVHNRLRHLALGEQRIHRHHTARQDDLA